LSRIDAPLIVAGAVCASLAAARKRFRRGRAGFALDFSAAFPRGDQRRPVVALPAQLVEDLHRGVGLRVDLDHLLVRLDRRIDLAEEVELHVAAP